MVQKPLLSVGIIFKNEIRCIERCLKSLVPLKELFPCEIVMADTGSDDGSREVAKRYADILIDFPWVNDFAAARNAVMERCTGKWYFSVDCDEWLGGDLSTFEPFLRRNEEHDKGAITVRNYKTVDFEDGNYTDFTAVRLLRMSTGVRFVGKIHEGWPEIPQGVKKGDYVFMLDKMVLRHDGYVAEQWVREEKAKRNMGLLKEKLKEHPGDLLTLVQCIESGQTEAEYADYVRQAVAGVHEGREKADRLGPSIFRYAAMAGSQQHLPEVEEWIREAEERYPDSIYTRVDVQYFALGNCWNKDDYDGSILHGEKYLQGVADLDAKNFNLTDLLVGSLLVGAPYWRQGIRVFLALAYIQTGKPEKALETLEGLDGELMDGVAGENLARACMRLHQRYPLDITPMLRRVWGEMQSEKPNYKQADARRSRFVNMAAKVFDWGYLEEEDRERDKLCRHAYTLFRCLEGTPLAQAVELMDAASPEEAERVLSQVEKWEEFPIGALEHALVDGRRFPPKGKPLPLEKQDALAIRMARDGGRFSAIVARAGEQDLEDLASLSWARAMTLAAVRMQGWKDPEIGMRDARQFAGVEGRFVSRCYAPGMLEDDTIWALPPMHRFGWYCAKAFEAKDTGRAAECVRLLRKGLETAPEMKSMVEFLLEQIEREERESAIASAPPELLELAGQVRGILEQYPPDDPAVKELKNSPVYQKVAYLIEEPATPGLGGIKQ